MASFQKPAKYSVAPAAVDLPPSILPFNPPRPPAAMPKQVVIQNATGSGNAGGRLEFQLPGGGFDLVKSGSMYIRGTLSVTGGGANLWTPANPSGSVAALIRQLQVQIGGMVAERIDRYDILHNILLIHTGGSYYANDAPVIERVTAGQAAGASFDFCLPVMSQLFNSGQAFPLWACSSGSVVISCDLNTAADAINEATSSTITNFTITNPQLVYDCIQMSPEFVMGMRSQMAQGSVYSIPFLSFRTTVKSDENTPSVNMALNASSLKACFFTSRVKANALDDGVFNGGTVTSVKLFVDGALINNVQQQKIADQYAELQKALSKLNDTSVAAGEVLSQTTYNSTFYTGAVNTICYDDAGYAYGGKGCSTLTLELSHTSTGGNLFVFAAYDTVLVIDPSGVPAVLQ